jgi:DNA-binding response OmpR family regulator
MVPPEPREVLVIDDEVDMVDVYKDILQTHNYAPIATTLWTEAVDAVQNQNPGLLILDLNMPTINGVALLQFLREQGHTLPVIVVSGYISKDIEETLRHLGVQAFVQKPFEVDHLAGLISRILEETESPGSSTLTEEMESPVSEENASEEAPEEPDTFSDNQPEDPEEDPEEDPQEPARTNYNLAGGPSRLAPQRRRVRRTAQPKRPSRVRTTRSKSFFRRHKALGVIAIICILIGLIVVIGDNRQYLQSRTIGIQQDEGATNQ